MRNKRFFSFRADQPLPNSRDYYCRFSLTEETYDSVDDARQRLANLHRASPDGPAEEEDYTSTMRTGFRVGNLTYVLQTDASIFWDEVQRLAKALANSIQGAELSRAIIDHRRTTRWTGVRIASFSTYSMMRSLDVIAAPGQLWRQIIISRIDPVRTHGCIGLDLSWTKHPEFLREDVEKHGVNQDYKIRLRSAPKVDLVEYTRFKESNSQIIVTKSTFIQNREFFEDGAMKSFDPRYRQLPDYYDKDSSLYLETTLHPWECIYPGDVARECESVLRRLDSIFTKYPEATNRRVLSWMGQ
jgi:hypothetical protein